MRISLKHLWLSTVEKYLDSVQYAFQKRDQVSRALEKMPEPLHSKKFKHISFFLLIFAVLVFLMSCTAHAQTEKEQLFIQRQQLNIQETEIGSSTGSIWADLPYAQGLSVGRQPHAPGDTLRISIPDELQEKGGDAPSASSFTMNIVGVEPGGHMLLRGVQTLVNEEGSKKTVSIFAEAPAADVTGPILNATSLSQITVEETVDELSTSYQTTSWDKNITRKISSPIPDTKKIIAGLEQQKKEIEDAHKNLESQRQALREQSDRLNQDRQRLEAEKAQAMRLSADPEASTREGATVAANEAQTNTSANTAKQTKGKPTTSKQEKSPQP